MSAFARMHDWRKLALWFLVIAAAGLMAYAGPTLAWLKQYPADWNLPLVEWSNALFDWLQQYRNSFLLVAALAKVVMLYVQWLLQGMPWLAICVVVVFTSYRAGGFKLALFGTACLAYTLATGLWVQSINTLALVIIALPFIMLLGFGLGVLGSKVPAAQRVLSPALDLMQTVPAFAYLIPAMVLLGFGPQVGLVVSVIFATPPLVRNVTAGLDAVPTEIREAADMSGASPWQRFWLAEFPTAMPQLIVGFNQSVLAAFSMVIVASVIGGFNDIGWEVSGNFRNQALGKAIQAGIVITLFAILVDRIGAGFARRFIARSSGKTHQFTRYLATAVIASLILAWLVPVLGHYPEAWTVSISEPIDVFMTWVLDTSAWFLRSVKFFSTVYVIKPVQVGLDDAVNEKFWGFSLSPTFVLFYVALLGAIAALLHRLLGLGAVIGVAILGTLVYFGTLDMPWPAWLVVIGAIAYKAGGVRTFLFAIAGMIFILASGMWEPATSSIALLIVAVTICLMIGFTIGIASAEFDTLSPIVRQVNDFLQSIPVYVLLIPPLWLFRSIHPAKAAGFMISARLP